MYSHERRRSPIYRIDDLVAEGNTGIPYYSSGVPADVSTGGHASGHIPYKLGSIRPRWTA